MSITHDVGPDQNLEHWQGLKLEYVCRGLRSAPEDMGTAMKALFDFEALV